MKRLFLIRQTSSLRQITEQEAIDALSAEEQRLDRVQIEVPMSNLFESPTIAGLARAVIEERSAQEDSEDLAAAVAALEQMSEEEVDALLSTSSDLPPDQGQKVSDA